MILFGIFLVALRLAGVYVIGSVNDTDGNETK